MAARMAIMAITTKSSMRVKAFLRHGYGVGRAILVDMEGVLRMKFFKVCEANLAANLVIG
jgi:hypothetical protein